MCSYDKEDKCIDPIVDVMGREGVIGPADWTSVASRRYKGGKHSLSSLQGP